MAPPELDARGAYEPAAAILTPQLAEETRASSSSVSRGSERASRPSVDPETRRTGGMGIDDEARKEREGGSRERVVMSSEWVDEWIYDGAEGLRVSL